MPWEHVVFVWLRCSHSLWLAGMFLEETLLPNHSKARLPLICQATQLKHDLAQLTISKACLSWPVMVINNKCNTGENESRTGLDGFFFFLHFMKTNNAVVWWLLGHY